MSNDTTKSKRETPEVDALMLEIKSVFASVTDWSDADQVSAAEHRALCMAEQKARDLERRALQAEQKLAEVEAERDEAQQLARAASITQDSLLKRIAEVEADAGRWNAFCNLWAASTILEATQDEDGYWSITQIEPAEEVTFSPLTGETPDHAIDAAVSKEG